MGRKWVEVLVLLLLAALALWDGTRIVADSSGALGTREAGGFIAFLGVLLVCLAAVYRLQGAPPGALSPVVWGRRVRRALGAFGVLAAYIFLIGSLGYLVSTVLFFVVCFRVFGSYRWPPVVAASLAIAIGSAYLWAILGMMLPTGILPWP